MKMNDAHSENSEKLLFVQSGNGKPLRFEHKAMNTVYEILINHADKEYAEQAANAAFDEIDRLELELSRFKENSDISRINALKQFEIITLGTDCYMCLEECRKLYRQTRGVFDISAGFIIDLWKKAGLNTNKLAVEQVEEALKYTGMPWLHLLDNYKVCLMSDKISLDLGGYGKGYALQVVCDMLNDWEITNGIINGGMSSMMPLADSIWPVDIRHPELPEKLLTRINLSRHCISGSGKRKGQHIIDPRNGYPVADKIAAWALAEDPGVSDALSTAFMIMSVDEIEIYCDTYNVGALLITSTGKILHAGTL
jgi:FAD:protein FMN transferase